MQGMCWCWVFCLFCFCVCKFSCVCLCEGVWVCMCWRCWYVKGLHEECRMIMGRFIVVQVSVCFVCYDDIVCWRVKEVCVVKMLVCWEMCV